MRGDLEDLRRRIDMLDEHIVRLLNARAACALEIGRLKRDDGIPIYQPAREAEVIAHVRDINTGPLDTPAIQRLFEAIRQLLEPPAAPHREIGFHLHERPVRYRVRTGRTHR